MGIYIIIMTDEKLSECLEKDFEKAFDIFSTKIDVNCKSKSKHVDESKKQEYTNKLLDHNKKMAELTFKINPNKKNGNISNIKKIKNPEYESVTSKYAHRKPRDVIDITTLAVVDSNSKY